MSPRNDREGFILTHKSSNAADHGQIRASNGSWPGGMVMGAAWPQDLTMKQRKGAATAQLLFYFLLFILLRQWDDIVTGKYGFSSVVVK